MSYTMPTEDFQRLLQAEREGCRFVVVVTEMATGEITGFGPMDTVLEAAQYAGQAQRIGQLAADAAGLVDTMFIAHVIPLRGPE